MQTDSTGSLNIGPTESNPESGSGSGPIVLGLSDPSLAAMPDQKTVISQRAPQAHPGHSPRPAELGKSLEGQRLGHFQLEEFVGGGGMGAVFRAIDTMLGRTVAVKVVGSAGNEGDTLRRFRNEAQSAARLDHENIARVYYVGEDAGWNYIVFEFIEGVNIRDLVEHKGPLSLDEAVTYTLQVADALEHASTRDVIHRDIKPSNLLVTVDGRAKLVDMGLARLHQVESSSEDLTASGVTLGTFDYISPEQARDPRGADVRSDLYSLGCTLYYMLTGFPPFPHGTVLQKLLSHSSEEPPDPSQYRDDLTEEVVCIINKLLAKNPRDRYQRPQELIVELKVLAEELGLETASKAGRIWIAPSQPRESFLERHLPWMVPVAALLLAVLLLDQFSASNQPVNISLPGNMTRVTRVSAAATTVSDAATPSDSRTGTRPSDSTPNTINSGRDAEPEKGVSDDPFVPTPGAAGPATDAAETRPDSASAIDSSDRLPPTSSNTPDDPPGPVVKPAPTEDVAGTAESTPGRGDAPRPAEADPPEDPAVTASPGDAPPRVGESMEDPQPLTDFVRLAVAAEDVEFEPGVKRVDSLKDAIAWATRLPGVSRIELHYDGPRTVEPTLEFPAELLAERSLSVEAAAGYSPVLVFRPTSDQLGSVQRPRMIRAGRGQLAFHGVHLLFEVPAESRQGWSLFHLDRGASVHLENSTLTIRNRQGAVLDDRVAFFELAAAVEVSAEPTDGLEGFDGGASDAEPARPPVSSISLLKSSARGQATLVWADSSRPVRLQWNQGFFCSTQRLLQVGGLKEPPKFEEGIIGLELRNVTSIVGPGLCLLRTDMNRPHQRNVLAQFDNCLFIATEPTAPVFEYDGTLALDDVRRRMTINGAGNYYDNMEVILRVRLAELPDLPSEVTFSPEHRSEAGDQRWYRELEPQTAAMLNLEIRVDPNGPVDDFLPADFQVKRGEGAMQFAAAGFDLKDLPAFPSSEASGDDREGDAVSPLSGSSFFVPEGSTTPLQAPPAEPRDANPTGPTLPGPVRPDAFPSEDQDAPQFDVPSLP